MRGERGGEEEGEEEGEKERGRGGDGFWVGRKDRRMLMIAWGG